MDSEMAFFVREKSAVGMRKLIAPGAHQLCYLIS